MNCVIRKPCRDYSFGNILLCKFHYLVIHNSFFILYFIQILQKFTSFGFRMLIYFSYYNIWDIYCIFLFLLLPKISWLFACIQGYPAGLNDLLLKCLSTFWFFHNLISSFLLFFLFFTFL